MPKKIVVVEAFGVAGKIFNKGDAITDAATIDIVVKTKPKRLYLVPGGAVSEPAAPVAPTPAPAPGAAPAPPPVAPPAA